MKGLVDCNNFYVSCERVFAPRYRNKPVVVLSNNDGCVIARSGEAKSLGIVMGTPAFLLKDLVRTHHVKVFSSNYALYGDMSRRVMHTIRSMVPAAEEYSIDETFIDLSGIRPASIDSIALDICQKVHRHTGISVGVGISTTRALAKLANRIAKTTPVKDKIHLAIQQEHIDGMLANTPVHDIWGIGAQRAAQLAKAGVHTAADFIRLPTRWISANMSVIEQRLQWELKGKECIPFITTPKASRTIVAAHSFRHPVSSRDIIMQALAKHTAAAARELRRQHLLARKLHVLLETNMHRPQDTQLAAGITIDLPIATDATAQLTTQAIACITLLFKEGLSYMKTGITLSDIIPSTAIQLSCFEKSPDKRQKLAMQTMDDLNAEMGAEKVRIARQGYDTAWRLRADHISKVRTTNWKHLPIINI